MSLYTIQNECLTVTAESLGAQLQSILSAGGTQYLWQGDSRYWSDRALNLFPYVARLTDGKYQLDGAVYEMGIHGLAPYRDFTLVEKSETAMTLELRSSQETLAVYPRDFSFRITYALEGSTLNIRFTVENRDGKTMYFGLGGHPGFNVPLAPGKAFEDYFLQFGEPCQPRRIGFTEDCFLDGTDAPFPLEKGCKLKLSHSLFDQDAIVLKDMASSVTLGCGTGASVTVTFPQMPYLGLWHWPKTDAPYLCIEPWCSLPARKGRLTVLEEQADLISLAPGGIYRNDWFIRIQE